MTNKVIHCILIQVIIFITVYRLLSVLARPRHFAKKILNTHPTEKATEVQQHQQHRVNQQIYQQINHQQWWLYWSNWESQPFCPTTKLFFAFVTLHWGDEALANQQENWALVTLRFQFIIEEFVTRDTLPITTLSNCSPFGECGN